MPKLWDRFGGFLLFKANPQPDSAKRLENAALRRFLCKNFPRRSVPPLGHFASSCCGLNLFFLRGWQRFVVPIAVA